MSRTMSGNIRIRFFHTLTFQILLFSSYLLSGCNFSAPVLLFDDQKSVYEFIIEVRSKNPPKLYINGIKQKSNPAQDTDLETIFRYTFSDWGENTEYKYFFRSGECSSDTFSFKTFSDKKFSHIDIVVGSCLNLRNNKPVAMLDSILKRKPQLMVWLGDNIYLNDAESNQAEKIIDRYRTYRMHPQLKVLLATVPSIAIHDDHDYGPNDTDSSYALRDVSNKIFRSFWYTSSLIQSTKGDDLFCTYKLGNFKFILTDNRSKRSKLSSTTPQTFGPHQLNRINSELNSGLQYCNIILSGGQILNNAEKYENLSQYKAEYKSFLKILENVNAQTLILSGDRHHGEITEKGNTTEVTTSPIQSSIYVTNEDNTLRKLGPIDSFNIVLLKLDAVNLNDVRASIEFITSDKKKYEVTEFMFRGQ